VGGDWKEMFHAAKEGDIDLLTYHLKMGVDPNYQHPEFLTTALIEATQEGRTDAVRCLLEYGADPSVKAIFGGDTALSLAKALRHKEIISLLKARL